MKMVKIAAFVILALIVIGLIILFIRNGYQILPPQVVIIEMIFLLLCKILNNIKQTLLCNLSTSILTICSSPFNNKYY